MKCPECDRCNGTGKIEKTEEEWLRSATTEELAEKLLEWWFNNATHFKLFPSEIDEAKKRIMMWLKQPHKE